MVANRLPVQRARGRDGSDSWQLSPGGLVRALQPTLEAKAGAWIGWPGDSAAAAPEPFTHEGVELHPIGLSAAEVEAHYVGFCNRTVWPLFHHHVRPPVYEPAWWKSYLAVNRRFADAALRVAGPHDVIWVHDYQLLLVPGMIRAQVPDANIGFFLHIPFPPVDLFARLPWRAQLLEGLLGADLLGFQTADAAVHFADAARRLTAARRDPGRAGLQWQDRRVLTEPFAISTDVTRFESLARQPAVRARAAQIAAELGDRRLILGVDRLDYTKGVPQRLRAFAHMLEGAASLNDEVVMVQVGVPTRRGVPEYTDLRHTVEAEVDRINDRFGTPERKPVHYLCRSLPPDELVAYFLAADVLAVTPLCDGMNLVAKEFVASRVDDGGVLVLSEFAGAAHELSRALTVNPYDVGALASTLSAALHLAGDDAAARMRRMRAHLRRHDVFAWSESFLEVLDGVTSLRRQTAATPAAVVRPRPGRAAASRAPITHHAPSAPVMRASRSRRAP